MSASEGLPTTTACSPKIMKSKSMLHLFSLQDIPIWKGPLTFDEIVVDIPTVALLVVEKQFSLVMGAAFV